VIEIRPGSHADDDPVLVVEPAKALGSSLPALQQPVSVRTSCNLEKPFQEADTCGMEGREAR
jgi:hypothetical protein